MNIGFTVYPRSYFGLAGDGETHNFVQQSFFIHLLSVQVILHRVTGILKYIPGDLGHKTGNILDRVPGHTPSHIMDNLEMATHIW